MQHIFWEKNGVVDMLAQNSHTNDLGYVYFDGPSIVSGFSIVLQVDLDGVSMTQFICNS